MQDDMPMNQCEMKAGINMGFEKRQTIDFVTDSMIETLFDLLGKLAPEITGATRAAFIITFLMLTYDTWDNWTWAE